jgi:hypothetical protein
MRGSTRYIVAPSMMESGLSRRTHQTLDALLPAFAAGAPPKHCDPSTTIDLSRALNEVIRPELLEFFKGIVEHELTSEVCRVQYTFVQSIDDMSRHSLYQAHHSMAAMHNCAKH